VAWLRADAECYPATAQAIIRALTGEAVSQEQIAHESYMYVAANDLDDKSRSDWKAIGAYGRKVKSLPEAFGMGASYAEVGVCLESADRALLRKSYGQLGLGCGPRHGLGCRTAAKSPRSHHRVGAHLYGPAHDSQ
jgi:hypothetical protein